MASIQRVMQSHSFIVPDYEAMQHISVTFWNASARQKRSTRLKHYYLGTYLWNPFQKMHKPMVRASRRIYWRVWTPPLLQALLSIANRYDCLRVSGLFHDAVFVGIGP